MSLSSGAHLGPYVVLSMLGKGGMGEVYRARDSKLNRDVALKVLPVEVAEDPQRIARFRREAQTLASLNHPYIGAIYGFEEAGAVSALVLELIEGQTLAHRLAVGRLPVTEALAIARQIAEALEAAHEKGILHRDLKPANIKLTPGGRVKVLDFGLAKILDEENAADPSQITITVLPTAADVVVGTPAYMSPEQARGEDVGRQTDIWSFGVVLYELLTGVSPFARPNTAETLAQVLQNSPDLGRLPADTPSAARHLLRRCLERDPRRRLQHIGDARIELEDATTSPPLDAAPVARAASLFGPGPLALVAVVAALAAVGGWLYGRQPSAGAVTTVRLALPFVDSPQLSAIGSRHVAISNDGSMVAFSSGNRVWLRRMDQKDAVALAGGFNPFFSPDNTWLGLTIDQVLAKVPIGGGPAQVIPISNRPSGRDLGADWAADNSIVFATTEGLFQVSANGGEARPLAAPNRERQEQAYAWPQVLPDGRHVVFTITRDRAAGGPQVAIIDRTAPAAPTVITSGAGARYTGSGQLVFASGSTLRAVAFDPDALQIQGQPVTVPGVDVAQYDDTGAAEFAVSPSGTLVFWPPRTGSRNVALYWIDRTGREEALGVEPRGFLYPRISPDGTRAAVEVVGQGERTVWVLDLQRLALARLSDGPEDLLAVWASDGQRVYYASRRSGNFDIYSQPSDGASRAKVEYVGPGDQMLQSITPDGTRLLVSENFLDLSVLELARPERLSPLLHTPFEDRLAQMSPDGKWFAYESEESGGPFEILLRSFPDPTSRRAQISTGGGRYPVWGPKGSNELYFVRPDGAMMAASVTLEPELRLGAVTKLFDGEKPQATRSGRPFDVSPTDGRFLVPKSVTPDEGGPTQVSVVLNWTEELKRLAAGP